MRKYSALLCLSLALGACGNFKHPTATNVDKMSADTLCYRYAYAKSNKALKDEVRARNLDCERIVQDQPQYTGERF